MQAKTNKQVAGEEPTLNDDNSGNPQVYFNYTNERLERLESASRSLGDEIKKIEKATRNLSDTEYKVRAFYSYKKHNFDLSLKARGVLPENLSGGCAARR